MTNNSVCVASKKFGEKKRCSMYVPRRKIGILMQQSIIFSNLFMETKRLQCMKKAIKKVVRYSKNKTAYK